MNRTFYAAIQATEAQSSDNTNFLEIPLSQWRSRDLTRSATVLECPTNRRKSTSLSHINRCYGFLLRDEVTNRGKINMVKDIVNDTRRDRRKYWQGAKASWKSDCFVCADKISISAMPKDDIASSYLHKVEICKTCPATHIEKPVEINGWQRIRCPHEGCNEHLDERSIRLHANAATVSRFDAFLLQQAFAGESDFLPCAKPGCSGGGLFDEVLSATTSFLTCQKCGGNTCLSCKTLWHTGETYEENREKMAAVEARRKELEEQDTKSTLKVERIAKRCPNVRCGWMIEKDDGCNYMTCKCWPE